MTARRRKFAPQPTTYININIAACYSTKPNHCFYQRFLNVAHGKPINSRENVFGIYSAFFFSWKWKATAYNNNNKQASKQEQSYTNQ